MRLKRSFCLLLMVSLFFSGANLTIASDIANAKYYDFSSFTQSDALNYVQEQGIILPDGLENIDGYETVILEIIQESYINENYIPRYNNPVMYNFASAIAVSVKENTNYNNKTSQMNTRATGYVLQHSTQHGAWNDAYLYYNCYGYAIGKTIYENPGYYSGHYLPIDATISDIAYYVKQDLVTLGYVVNVSTICPSTLPVGKKLICVRMEDFDYHFMKYSGGTWYHKPGYSNPLKYNYSSAGYTVWTDEQILRDVAVPPSVTYDSSIYYITYWLSNENGDVGTLSFYP